jgi:hypothetical protein
MWLARRVAVRKAVPGSNPTLHPSLGSAQENPGAEKYRGRFFPAQQQEIPAQQQAINFSPVLLTPLNSISPVSLTPVININSQISPRIFEKIQKGSNGILGGLGPIHEKS